MSKASAIIKVCRITSTYIIKGNIKITLWPLSKSFIITDLSGMPHSVVSIQDLHLTLQFALRNDEKFSKCLNETEYLSIGQHNNCQRCRTVVFMFGLSEFLHAHFLSAVNLHFYFSLYCHSKCQPLVSYALVSTWSASIWNWSMIFAKLKCIRGQVLSRSGSPLFSCKLNCRAYLNDSE